MDFKIVLLLFCIVSLVVAGISPIHDLRDKINSQIAAEKLIMSSPHKVIQHLDDSISKATKNVTENPRMEESLYQMSKDLVSAILSKLEIQEKITRITKEALEAPGKNKGITAIETRRILDYISRTLSGHILTITRASTEPELHRLVYGLAQIAAEVSIVAALKDITYATALSKKQSVDLSLRKKRSIETKSGGMNLPTDSPMFYPETTVYNAVLNKSLVAPLHNQSLVQKKEVFPMKLSPFSVVGIQKPLHIIKSKHEVSPSKGFLNQTSLDADNNQDFNDTAAIILDKSINATAYERVDTADLSAPGMIDEWVDTDNTFKPINPDMIADIEIDRPDIEDEVVNEKKMKQKMEKLEVKAKKAILYAGDVAYLTAASVVALRRALTASIEVNMSVRYAKSGMSNHQDLMMNLAKTAAQQAGKEAKSATSKSLACERVIKLALKYTAQSYGANLNHVANRIVMDTLSLSTLAKSMAFVANDIAINSLYLATDVKPPS